MMGLGDRFKKLLGTNTAKPPTFEERVGAFWAWWRENAEAFARGIDRGEAARWSDEISERLDAVEPELQWETGPGRKSKHHFAISAAGDAELRVVVERVLSQAPAACADWEYYSARQRAEADMVATIEFDDGLTIDYRLMAIGLEEDEAWRKLHVTLFHPAFEELEDGRAHNISFLFLDMLLGEDEVERWIGAIETTRNNPPDSVSGGELRERVDSMAEQPSDHLCTITFEADTARPLIASWRTPLKRLDHLFYDHHVEIVMSLSAPNDSGLCDEAELAHLSDMEDELVDALGNYAVWFGHVTGNGQRSIRLQVLPMSPATELIESWMGRHPEYEIDFSVSHDPAWRRFRDVKGALALPDNGG